MLEQVQCLLDLRILIIWYVGDHEPHLDQASEELTRCKSKTLVVVLEGLVHDLQCASQVLPYHLILVLYHRGEALQHT